MEVTITVDKETIARPGEVMQSLQELRRWSSIRREQSLPTGALDHAIRHMMDLHKLACCVYNVELNTPPDARPDFEARADSTLAR